MRGLVQRVTRATVTVGAGDVCGEIGTGLVVFVGVTHDDTDQAAAKIWNLR